MIPIKQAIEKAQDHCGQVYRVEPGVNGFGYCETGFDGRTWAARACGNYHEVKRYRAIRVAGYALYYLGIPEHEDPWHIAQDVCWGRNTKNDVRAIVQRGLVKWGGA